MLHKTAFTPPSESVDDLLRKIFTHLAQTQNHSDPRRLLRGLAAALELASTKLSHDQTTAREVWDQNTRDVHRSRAAFEAWLHSTKNADFWSK